MHAVHCQANLPRALCGVYWGQSRCVCTLPYMQGPNTDEPFHWSESTLYLVGF